MQAPAPGKGSRRDPSPATPFLDPLPPARLPRPVLLRPVLLRPVLLLAPVALLVACSDQGGGERSGGATGRSTDSTQARPGACTTDPTSTGLFTDPGQVLCFGTRAVLPLTTSDGSGTTGRMSLTVTGIERGEDAVIDTDITAGMAEWTSRSRDLWYVRAESELLSEEVPGAFENEDPMGILSSISSAEGDAGESYIDFDIDRTVGDCERRVFEEESTGAFATCLWRVMAPGVEPATASWSDTGDYLGDGTLTWAP